MTPTGKKLPYLIVQQLIHYSWLYRRTIVVDGNFKAENLRMKRPDDDVALHDGLGYMVQSHDYEQHLNETVEPAKVRQISIKLVEIPD